MKQLNLDAAFAEIVQENSQGFGHDRQKTIGSSEIGACALRIGRRKLGVKPDASYKDAGGFAMRGNVMEDNVCVPVIRKAVEAIGGTLLYAGQKDQLSLINERAFASATPDGLAIDVPREALAEYGVKDLGTANRPCFMVEIKSIDPRKNMEKLPDPKHVDQINYAMGLMRSYKDAEFKPEHALLVYTDASDYSKITPFAVQFDEKGFMGQLARAKHIMNAVGWCFVNRELCWRDDEGKIHRFADFQKLPESKRCKKSVEALRPEGKVAGGRECKTCEFGERCLGYVPMVPRVIQKVKDEKTVAKINKIASRYKEADEATIEWSKHRDETKAKLKEVLAQAGTKFLETDFTKLNWSTSEGRSTWDAERMAKELTKLGVKNVEKKFKRTGKPSESLSVKFVSALSS